MFCADGALADMMDKAEAQYWQYIGMQDEAEHAKNFATNMHNSGKVREALSKAGEFSLMGQLCSAAPVAAPVVGQEPDAYMLEHCGGEYSNLFFQRASAEHFIKQDDMEVKIVPLYVAPAPAPAASVQPAPFPERDQSQSAERQGIFQKFDVRRVDGSGAPGGKHHGCRYFVLDMDHDQHAGPALVAYAASCAATHPALSAELAAKFGRPDSGRDAALVDINAAAKAIYYLIPAKGDGDPHKYPWVHGGNSDMQELAREMARAALASHPANVAQVRELNASAATSSWPPLR